MNSDNALDFVKNIKNEETFYVNTPLDRLFRINSMGLYNEKDKQYQPWISYNWVLTYNHAIDKFNLIFARSLGDASKFGIMHSMLDYPNQFFFGGEMRIIRNKSNTNWIYQFNLNSELTDIDPSGKLQTNIPEREYRDTYDDIKPIQWDENMINHVKILIREKLKIILGLYLNDKRDNIQVILGPNSDVGKTYKLNMVNGLLYNYYANPSEIKQVQLDLVSKVKEWNKLQTELGKRNILYKDDTPVIKSEQELQQEKELIKKIKAISKGKMKAPSITDKAISGPEIVDIPKPKSPSKSSSDSESFLSSIFRKKKSVTEKSPLLNPLVQKID
jgi:hypothetical protein